MLRYKLRSTTVAVHQAASHPVVVTIPSGSILRVADDSPGTAALVEAEWDGRTVQVFAVDLHDRAELIKARSG
jgi:polyphosphate kinase